MRGGAIKNHTGPNVQTWTIPGKAGCLGSLTGTPTSPRNPWTCTHRPGSLSFYNMSHHLQEATGKGEDNLSSICHSCWKNYFTSPVHLTSGQQYILLRVSHFSFASSQGDFSTQSFHYGWNRDRWALLLLIEMQTYLNKTNTVVLIFIKLWHPIIGEGGREPSSVTTF